MKTNYIINELLQFLFLEADKDDLRNKIDRKRAVNAKKGVEGVNSELWSVMLRERWKVYEHYAFKCVLDWFRRKEERK